VEVVEVDIVVRMGMGKVEADRVEVDKVVVDKVVVDKVEMNKVEVGKVVVDTMMVDIATVDRVVVETMEMDKMEVVTVTIRVPKAVDQSQEDMVAQETVAVQVMVAVTTSTAINMKAEIRLHLEAEVIARVLLTSLPVVTVQATGTILIMGLRVHQDNLPQAHQTMDHQVHQVMDRLIMVPLVHQAMAHLVMVPLVHQVMGHLVMVLQGKHLPIMDHQAVDQVPPEVDMDILREEAHQVKVSMEATIMAIILAVGVGTKTHRTMQMTNQMDQTQMSIHTMEIVGLGDLVKVVVVITNLMGEMAVVMIVVVMGPLRAIRV